MEQLYDYGGPLDKDSKITVKISNILEFLERNEILLK